MRILLAARLAAATFAPAWGADLAFESGFVRLTLAEDGEVRSLAEKQTGNELLVSGQLPFASVRKSGQTFPSTSLTLEGGLVTVGFGASGVEADLRIPPHPHYLTVELVAVHGEGFEELRFAQVFPNVSENEGRWLNVKLDDRVAVCVMGLSDTSDVFTVPGDAVIDNEFGAQPLKFRLQAVPVVAPPADAGNVVLLAAEPRLALGTPGAGATMPGALDLTRHRALAMTLVVAGRPPVLGEPPAVLDVQLEDTLGRYRDYDVDLDFAGEKTAVIPAPTPERTLAEFRPAPADYPYKAAVSAFDYGAIAAVNLRWARSPRDGGLTCRVARVEALAESDVTVRGANLEIAGLRLLVPVDLRSGDYVEFWGQGPMREYDRNGVLLATVPQSGPVPTLQHGLNTVLVRSDERASVKLTAITVGEPNTF
jgi:hypothetical protein